jgi:DHA1 family tetracycline resistance protein-like MFS transporter
MLGLGILIPVFPQLVGPESPHRLFPASWSASDDYVAGGWLLATFPLLQFLCAPVLGQLSDRIGRRPVLAFSILGSALSMALFAVAVSLRSLELAFAARALDGATGGNISVANAAIGDVTAPEDRAKSYGLVGAALGLGFILGPFLGGILCDPSHGAWAGVATPFWAVSLLALGNALLVLRKLPETRAAALRADLPPLRWTRSFSNIAKTVSVPAMRRLVPALFLFNAGFTFFSTFWGVVLVEDFRFDPAQVGAFFGYMGLMIVFAQGGVVRRMPARLRDATVLPAAMLLVGASLVPFVFIPGNRPDLIWWVPPFLAVGTALARSHGTALLVRTTPEAMRGEVMGIHSSAYALAQLIPSALSGYVAAREARLTVLVGVVAALAGWALFVATWREPDPE